MTNGIALWSMLLLQKEPKASVSKVGGASGCYSGVNLWVSEVGQSFAIGRHPSYRKIKEGNQAK